MPQIIRNTKFKQVLPDNFTYKGVKYTKAYYKDKIMFGQSNEYKGQYFTIESLEDGNTITLTIGSGVTSSQMTYVAYSTDGANWTQTNVDSTTQTINVNLDKGDKVYWKGSGTRMCSSSDASTGASIFTATKQHKVYGNIMSLLYADSFVDKISFPGSNNARQFQFLFYNNTTMTDAKDLILPVTTLKSWCYDGMFSGCTSLASAPELPVTTLAQSCYYEMFRGCTSLKKAPELPATTLAQYCYNSMFIYCSSLVEPPELPATNLPLGVYQYMFNGCTSLKKAPELPATTLAQYCYRNMFAGCTSLVAAPELPATTLAQYCYSNMFNGCTSLTIVPELPATTLANYCYDNMFYGCTSLVQAPQLPATTMYVRCYNAMFRGCTSLTEAPDLPATTLADYCYCLMFYGCSSLEKAPILPATILPQYCYNEMFRGCRLIDEITCLATDISAANCVYNWLYGVASTGTFYKDPSMNDWTLNSPSGIPTGWTVYGTSQHTVTLTVNNQAYGNVTGAGTYYYNQECTIKANAVIGYKFVGWYDGNTLISDLDGYIFTVTQDVTWQAVFEEAVIDYSEEYFTLETDAYTDVLTIYNPNHSTNFTSFEYSTDGGNNWISVTWGNNPQREIYTNANFKTIKIRSVCTSFTGVLFYTGDDSSWKVYGNIMSLVYGSNFIGVTNLPISDYDNMIGCTFDGAWISSYNGGRGAQNGLFTNMNIVSAENLILPSLYVPNSCYSDMFKGCINLTNAPALPGTTLANYCYNSMFDGCKSLTSAPNLPALTVPNHAYYAMFRECTSLTQPPTISATRVEIWGCMCMFSCCESLSSLPTLRATYVAESGYERMFEYCYGLGSISLNLPATNGSTSCYDRMFYECNNLRGSVTLRLDVVPYYAYDNMFYNTNISHIWCRSRDSYATINYGVKTTSYPSLHKYHILRSASTIIKNAKPTDWTLEYID